MRPPGLVPRPLARASLLVLAAGLGLAGSSATGASPRRLVDIRPVATATIPAGSWTEPVPSPDGRWLAFTRSDHRGLWILERGTGVVRQLSDAPGVGVRFAWRPDSAALALRQSTGGLRRRQEIVVVGVDGGSTVVSPLVDTLSTPTWDGETLVAWRLAGERPEPFVSPSDSPRPGAGRVALVATPQGRLWRRDGDRLVPRTAAGPVLFHPVVSPDGRLFVVEALDGRLRLGRVDGGELEELGPGSYPSFIEGGRAILFERTSDDGHRLTGGDLWRLDLATREAVPLTSTPDRIERRPRLADDGETLFFEVDGELREGRLR